MKAFDKYWNTLLYSRLEDSHDKNVTKIRIREAWKAALEWVNSHLTGDEKYFDEIQEELDK